MVNYWARHRLLFAILLSAVIALVSGFLFVLPCVNQSASNYNAQSIYKSSRVDFIVPEPSADQINEITGTNGIDRVFPFYLTKTQVYVGGKQRTTTVLLSDQFQNLDITMYNPNRLIEKSTEEFDNPILVDWQFCHDTSAKIGDKITFSLDGENTDFRISAIYETNSVYDVGAILAQISDAQKDSIIQNSKNNGYSAMYVSANDYNLCRSYLTTNYRPLGRLKDRSQFESDEQYQVHYNAIMSSGFTNEITDFRIKESSLDTKSSSLMIWLGAILSLAVIIVFNIVMSRRGCEKVYFRNHCIPKGISISPYYNSAFIFESISFIVFYAAVIVIAVKSSNMYIPSSALGIKLTIVPVAVIIAEIISLVMNKSMITKLTIKLKVEPEEKAKKIRPQ